MNHFSCFIRIITFFVYLTFALFLVSGRTWVINTVVPPIHLGPCENFEGWLYSFVSYMVNRFVLEPKTVLEGEQEQKLKDSEAAIASLQVNHSLSREYSLFYITNMFAGWLSDIQGILGEADSRSGEQLEGVVAARTWHCSSNNVHVYVTFYFIFTPNPERNYTQLLSLVLLYQSLWDWNLMMICCLCSLTTSFINIDSFFQIRIILNSLVLLILQINWCVLWEEILDLTNSRWHLKLSRYIYPIILASFSCNRTK